MKRYNPKDIEPKWQKIWEETGVYTTDFASPKPKYFAMSMFNYPSGAGIHIGHAMNYTISDVKARFKRQQGFESYHPIGWDAFGLPAENYAIKSGTSPQESMANIIPDYHKQYKAMGWSNDWEKEISTHLPEYYKWTQWIFLKMLENGLVYQDSRLQWWCSIDNTVLANEQVIDGKCWRHDGPDDPLVEKKEIKQWFFKITEYADELLDAVDDLDWTESVKLAQKNWIGRSKGVEVDFKVENKNNFVLLHGFTGTPKNDFFPWAEQELNKAGNDVYVPELPNTDKPDAVEQAKYVLEHANFNDQTVLLGHSYGSVGALRVVEQLKSPIKKLVLVAAFAKPGFLDKERVFEKSTDWHFDFEKIKSNVQQIIILRDTTDPIVPADRADFLAEKLGGKIVDFKAEANHVTGDKEPVVLKNLIDNIQVFTTAHDTIYGVTFVVLAPEHELVKSITTADKKSVVNDYVVEAEKKSELERQTNKDKTGVFTGVYAINPINDKKVPIWVADYVLGDYGTGAVMAVPGEDERDHEFAEKFDLQIIYTTKQQEFVNYADIKAAPEKYILANSDEFDGLNFKEGRQKILDKLISLGVAQKKINYRMNDWSVGRQRYWGAPIPIVHCPKCGAVAIPEAELPVILPEMTDFEPSGDGRSALAKAKDWLVTECPKCGGVAERETDTMDTYVDSAWYMLRYLDPHNQSAIFNSEVTNHWMPVDFYNGADHATAHLLYARFIVRFLSKIGLVKNPEPFKRMLFNGKVLASDGSFFSKSKGNGVDPLEIIDQGYGADALRTYLMFTAPLEIGARWDARGVPGTHRFLSRLWNIVQEYLEAGDATLSDKQSSDLLRATHQMIKKVTGDIEADRYNTAIAASMQCLNDLYKLKVEAFGKSDEWKEAVEALVSCVAPFAPHIADELWQQLGHSNSIHKDSWPEYNEKYLITDKIKVVVQVNGKLRAEIEVEIGATESSVIEAAKADENVASHLKDKETKRTIYVVQKLVNFVV
jgi:leucyl-tRNA synthetase